MLKKYFLKLTRKMWISFPILLIIIILAFFYWLDYITKADKGFCTYSIGLKTYSVCVPDLTTGKYDPHLKNVQQYATLASLVYRSNGNDTITSYKKCKLVPIPQIEPAIPVGKKKLPGLKYEIWEIDDDTINVAIVFRGTDSLPDWKANFRWFFKLFDGVTYDHYDQLALISHSIVDSIKSNYTNQSIKIISIGHSLGGGLAQYMAYAIPEINHVYTFNSSPVTAYYSVKLKALRNENKKNAVIYRLYESGEALTFIRKAMTFLYPVPLIKKKDPAIIRIRFDFSSVEDPVSQHSIQDFANYLEL